MRTLTVTAEPTDALYLKMSACALSDDARGIEADLTTTIGLGGLDLLLRVEKGGKHVTEIINLRQFVQDWVEKIAEEIT